MAENGPLPDHLRCKRTDGRRWRCGRKVMQGKKLCEIHHLQGMHRQHKWKVPESLKIQREFKNSNNKNGGGVRLSIEGDVILSKLGQKRKKPEGFRDVVKKKKKKKKEKKEKEKIKGKKNTVQFELIRMVLKRQVEKRKGQSANDKKSNSKSKSGSSDTDSNSGEEEEEDDEEEELMRDLPNGFMAISPAKHFNNVGSGSASMASCDVKIGVDLSSKRRFRSKNLEPLPIGAALQVKDMVELKRGKKKQKCHWCRKNGLSSTLIQCSSCKKEFFCMDCIKDRYFDEQEEVQNACPVCRGTCGCKPCSAARFRDSDCEEFSNGRRQVNKVLYFHYMICMLLPVLKQMNQDLAFEIDMEAKVKGLKPSDIRVKQAKVSSNQRSCNKCKVLIVDFHRSCQSCSYNICLNCCRDVLHGRVRGNVDMLVSKCPTRRKTLVSGKQQAGMRVPKKRILSRCQGNRKAFNGCGGIPCPSSEFGGCGESLLDLSSLFPLSWVEELETSAEELIGCYELPETLDINSGCSLCAESYLETDEIRQSQEASAREDSQDNLLYCPTAVDIHSDNLEHFQKHWGKGQPVKVRNVLLGTSDLSWDPIVLFCTYLKNNAGTPGNTQATVCLDHFEVEIGVQQLFMGSIRGPKKDNMWHESLKLKGWLSPQVIQEHLPAHYSEILHALPFPEYMDPTSGILNIAAELPQEIPKPELGPSVYISYHSGSDIVRADSLSKLRYDTYDVVNVLVHASDAPVSTEQLNYIRKLMKKNSEENQASGRSIEELRLHDLVEEEIQLHRKVARVSWFTAAAAAASTSAAQHEAHDEKHGEAFYTNGVCSDTDSDTDTDTDTEVSKFFFGPAKGSRTSEHRTYGRKRAETASKEASVSEKYDDSCGAVWDVFRRQDVPKLIEYLQQHSNEFVETYGSRKPVTHPVHDQIFFLEARHKRRLKEEFEIEPWTFEQHVGEAVVVPAGCPYQIRNLKSCVNIVLDFVSPESVIPSMQLIDELRLLPDKHKARADCLEVKQMAIHSVDRAIKAIRELTSCTD